MAEGFSPLESSSSSSGRSNGRLVRRRCRLRRSLLGRFPERVRRTPDVEVERLELLLLAISCVDTKSARERARERAREEWRRRRTNLQSKRPVAAKCSNEASFSFAFAARSIVMQHGSRSQSAFTRCLRRIRVVRIQADDAKVLKTGNASLSIARMRAERRRRRHRRNRRPQSNSSDTTAHPPPGLMCLVTEHGLSLIHI